MCLCVSVCVCVCACVRGRSSESSGSGYTFFSWRFWEEINKSPALNLQAQRTSGTERDDEEEEEEKEEEEEEEEWLSIFRIALSSSCLQCRADVCSNDIWRILI